MIIKKKAESTKLSAKNKSLYALAGERLSKEARSDARLF